MRIGIVGVGGVGGNFGARLIQAGHEVVLLARGEHLRAIRADGLHVATPTEDFTVRPAAATDDATSLGTVDLVLVAVKAWQLIDALPAVRALTGERTTVLPLLNGVDAAEVLAGAVGRDHVVGGLCYVIAAMVAPGQIQQIGTKNDVVLGELDGHRSERVETLRALFDSASIPATVPENIHAALWKKLLFVAPFGVVGAVARAPLGVLRAVPASRDLIERCMREIGMVAAAHDARLSEEAIPRAMAGLDAMPPDATASLQRDLVAGRRSELEAQAGVVVRLGARAGVSTPCFATLYAGLLPIEWQAQGRIP
jgi:2-dehydropantoate 2-reductase